MNNDAHTTSTGQSTHSVQKIMPAAHFFLIIFACGAVFNQKILPAALFLHTKNLCVRHLISVSSLLYRFIGIENKSNSKTE